MGYETQFFIRVEEEDESLPDDELLDNIVEVISEVSLYQFEIGNEEIMGHVFQLGSYEGIKWYNRDEDMASISKAYPDLVFTIIGLGEDTFDMWWQHFKNGVTEGPHTIQIAYTPYGANRP